MKRHLLTFLLGAAVAAVAASAALASATPVGKLPAGKTVTVKVMVDKPVTVTLPKPAIKGGVWRVARSFDAKVVQQQSERTLANGSIRIVLHSTGSGTTRVIFALTKGETAKAFAARTYEITVGDKPPPEMTS